jgi:hypothetical protein
MKTYNATSIITTVRFPISFAIGFKNLSKNGNPDICVKGIVSFLFSRGQFVLISGVIC